MNEQVDDSFLIARQLFPPRIGEEVTIYDVDADGTEMVSGRVIDIHWAYINEEDGAATRTVVVRP